MDTTLRVAVIGAGPSGLTAAHTLAALGYTDVTVFESEDRVGGKVKSVTHEGRTFELGAYVVTEAYETVLSLVEENNLELREAPPRYVVDMETGRTRDFGDFLADRYGTLTSLVSIARFLWLTRKHRDLYEPGLVGADPSLRPTFSDYIRGRGIDPVAHLFRPVFCSLGYGYFEEIPALYVLKFLDRSKIIIVLKSALGVEQSWPRVFTTGFQSLWEAVAARLDVRLSSRVSSVKREGSEVKITVNDKEEHTFDRVIVACQLSTAKWFLDTSDEEKDLFDRVRNLRYYATLFYADGLSPMKTVYIEQHQVPETIGRTLLISNPYPDGDLYLAYHFGADKDSGQQITANLKEDVERLGGTFKGVYEQRNWSYFPHVQPADLEAGFFERIDALQGQRNTLYVGGTLNFETVEDSAAHARAMVLKHYGR
jgi:oxygen-dependent protoporphyrinogen oxidase